MSGNEGGLGKALTGLFINIVAVVIVLAGIDYVFKVVIPSVVAMYPPLSALLIVLEYQGYVMILATLGLGVLVISSFANAIYYATIDKYGESGAIALRNLVRITGIGAVLAAIAGGVAGGAAGVALGGFMGMVIGFASQQVLGQAVAGVFLLLARPFTVGDRISAAKEDEIVVKEITALFTIAERPSGELVLIPNNSLIGQKIIVFREKLGSGSEQTNRSS